ncbi:MAG: nuclear transport factor 2 family protein [Flavobacteriales bacterium]|nr:nuclear transport factor 2 family protein [Flavobacteriales bacterium]
MHVLERFYSSFSGRDPSAMGACYHPGARFSDPVFADLDVAGVRAMWRMLLTSGTDLRITYKVLEADANGGKVLWEAWYSFGPGSRKVHNVITSRFSLRDGLIFDHRDSFSFWRWSRQALGPIGWLLGWSPLLKAQVRSKAMASLRKAMSGRNATA